MSRLYSLPGQAWWKPALWAGLLFVLCLNIYGRHHRFPFYYHPDEPGKVEQVLTGQWNFHHPMLLLNTVRAAVKLQGAANPSPQAVVETGRTVSALFMATAAVALSLLAYLWRGWSAAIIGGVALALHHQLYELAHYLKEDSALLAGVALAFLAAYWFAQGPSPRRALLLGAGCGLAIAGKYLGVVTLGVALPLLWQTRREVRLRLLGLGLLACALTFVAVNWPLVAEACRAPAGGTVHHSLANEMDEVVHGSGRVTRRIPHALYWNVFVDNTTPVIWLLLIAFFSRHLRARNPEQFAQRLLAFFPVVFTLALSFSPKENDRYFLPATAMFTLLAALGVSSAPSLAIRVLRFLGGQRPEELFTPRVRLLITCSLGGLLWVVQLTGWYGSKPGLLRYDTAFVQNDIADLETWMRANLPPEARVLADSRTGLQDPAKYRKRKLMARSSRVPQALTVVRLVAEKGSLEELREQGYQYVVVSETSYGRYFRGDLHAKDEHDPTFLRNRDFYAQLLRQGEALFGRDRGTVIYLHPGFRVYRL